MKVFKIRDKETSKISSVWAGTEAQAVLVFMCIKSAEGDFCYDENTNSIVREDGTPVDTSRYCEVL